MKLGLDFGSRNIHAAVIDGDKVVFSRSVSHQGNVPPVLNEIIADIVNRFGADAILSYGVTGSINLYGIKTIDTILATIEANKFLATGIQNVLSIGCESFYLLLLDDRSNYIDHSFNTDCASGTGSFIDQQAKRLGFSTEEFAKRADGFTGKSPTIATRCAVFAKSDIIHSQAEGFSKEAIAAGICEGVVRSILANVIKGRKFKGELLLIGGVSLNHKMLREFEKELGSPVKVLDIAPVFNAIGAAAAGKEKDLNLLKENAHFRVNRQTREKLEIKLTDYPDFNGDKMYKEDGVEITVYRQVDGTPFNGYLGLDVGSTSSKAILLDEQKNILLGLYTATAGDPVSAVSLLLRKIKELFRDKHLQVKGVAVTGSGRLLIKEIIGADIAVNEITAHAKGATFLDPQVDTIIEIGGQDSKFTLLKNGHVSHSVMNYVCAAGTGSFIEEQSKKLGIELDQISAMALGQEAPLTSDRCTVYMERDLNVFLAEGWKKEQLMASVLFSVRDNYLSKVAGRTLFGNKVYFQGATARNKALVAAFENEIGKPIAVSKYCHLTGSLGSALIAIDRGLTTSAFRGVDLHCDCHTEVCDICNNHCSMMVYDVNGGKVAWGLKCGRDYEDKKVGSLLNPVSKLEKRYHTHFSKPAKAPVASALTIGIPNALFMKEYTPLFKEFFERLGCNVIVEENSARNMEMGKEISYSEFCAPLLLTHGLIRALMQKKVDRIFFPTVINEQSYLDKRAGEENFLSKDRDAYFCYYSAYAPTVVDNLLTLDLAGKMISPKIKFNNRPLEAVAQDIAAALVGVNALDKDTIIKIFLEVCAEDTAKKEFWRQSSRRLLAEDPDKIKVLLLGRPYVVFDKTMNKGIPVKIESMGFDLLHQSMLDLKYEAGSAMSVYLEKMHWFYGQQVLLSAETAVKQDNVYPILLTSFRCSPDAYVVTYFKEMMEAANKPYLIIQIDEHSSDVGYQTRIEAGVDAFMNDFEQRKKAQKKVLPQPVPAPAVDVITQEDTIYFPYLSPVIDEIIFDAFAAHGYTAKGLPLDAKTINLGYRYVSGGECMPNVAIVGSIIALFKEGKLDPKKSVIYLGDSCVSCNFHQYTSLIQAACKKAGMEGVRISAPKMGLLNNALPRDLALDMTACGVLGSLLYKLYFRYHPYEKVPGDTQKALDRSKILVREYLRKKMPLWEIPVQYLGFKGMKLYSKYFKKKRRGPLEVKKVSIRRQRQENKLVELAKEFFHPSKYMIEAAKEIRGIFDAIPVTGGRKPRIGLLGDLYVKYNTVINEDIYRMIEELGGEVLIPSYMETSAHLLDANTRESNASASPLVKLTRYEQSFEDVFKGILDGSFEPPMEECVALLKENGFEHYIPGETTMNLCRLLYYAKHKLVDAVVHVNPILCCPGTVSSSLFRKLQKDLNLPIVDVYYDGINKPNKVIVPQMSKLMEEFASAAAHR